MTLLENPAVPYGGSIAKLDDDLFTCIADKERFDEFVSIINGELISFILSSLAFRGWDKAIQEFVEGYEFRVILNIISFLSILDALFFNKFILKIECKG